jgi:hypothetical protein
MEALPPAQENDDHSGRKIAKDERCRDHLSSDSFPAAGNPSNWAGWTLSLLTFQNLQVKQYFRTCQAVEVVGKREASMTMLVILL